MMRRRAVILLHTLSDGSSHYDLMLELLPDPERSLLTIRLPDRIDQVEPGMALSGSLLAPHRTIYLAYEGPIAGHRGAVRRIARGCVRSASDPVCAPFLTCELTWGPSEAVRRIEMSPDPDRAPDAEGERPVRLRVE